MAKRIILGTLVIAAVALAVVFAVPATRYQILAYLRNEPLHKGRPLAYWVAALKHSDADVRREAALILEDVSGDFKGRAPEDPEYRAIIAGLASAIGDSDPFVRKCAAKAYLNYPREAPVPTDSETVTQLFTGLGDTQQVLVRKAAGRALWQAGPAAKQGPGVPALIAATYDSDDFVREYAARTLGRIGPEAIPAVPELLDLLRKDPERDVREHAAKSLGLIGSLGLGARQDEVVQALLKGLKDEAADVRENSARSLGQLGAKVAIPDLRQLAQDPKEAERVRAAATEALSRLGAGLDAQP